MFDELYDHLPFNRIKDRKLELTNKPVIFFVILVSAVFVIFLLRSFYLQVIDSHKYQELAEDNRFRTFTIPAERGVIYDRNNNILARNKPAFSIQMNTKLCFDAKTLYAKCIDEVHALKAKVDFDESPVIQEIEKGRSSIIVAAKLTKEQVLPIEANLDKFTSVSINILPFREYPYGEAFSHVLGYVGLADTLEPKIIGKSGIEAYYDEYLSGISGAQIVEVDSFGGHFKNVGIKDAYAGRNITTYLDKDLQVKAFELLKAKIEDKDAKVKATGGAVIAQDPSTGGVLAMVSYPSFDPNKLSYEISPEELTALNNDTRFPFFNRVISAAYAPGSTFKMVMGSAILMEKLVSPDFEIFDPGFINVSGFIFKNWKLDGHKEVNLYKALQVSNDTYFYTMGGGYNGVGGLGIEKIYNWATKFGFGYKTGIDLNGEVAGYFPNGKSRTWYLGDTFITSIGQGDVLATPLQTNVVTTLFQTMGKIFIPRVVSQIEGEEKYLPVVKTENIADKQSIETVRKGLQMAVEPGGTGYPFFDFDKKHKGIKVAGKTGTSEYYKPDGTYATHAWFTVFGPLEDKPGLTPITLTVFIEGGGGGADDAAPIARELMDLWFSKQGY